MQDPYHEVQSEIQSSLQNAITLRSSYQRIKSTAGADSEELAWARNEVRVQFMDRFNMFWLTVSIWYVGA